VTFVDSDTCRSMKTAYCKMYIGRLSGIAAVVP